MVAGVEAAAPIALDSAAPSNGHHTGARLPAGDPGESREQAPRSPESQRALEVQRAPEVRADTQAHAPGSAHPGPNGPRSSCTAPQLKRFIKSRVYVPMHELRRRFQINGGDDEVTVIHVGTDRVYVGLPDREGRLLGELLRGGDVGYELSMDPPSPIVVGLYPMRPIPRP